MQIGLGWVYCQDFYCQVFYEGLPKKPAGFFWESIWVYEPCPLVPKHIRDELLMTNININQLITALCPGLPR